VLAGFQKLGGILQIVGERRQRDCERADDASQAGG
jgi:hypothetical protein